MLRMAEPACVLSWFTINGQGAKARTGEETEVLDDTRAVHTGVVLRVPVPAHVNTRELLDGIQGIGRSDTGGAGHRAWR